MPFDLALADLILPYVLKGDSYGKWHAALSILRVTEITVASDDGGVAIHGVAKPSLQVRPWFDWKSLSFGIDAENTEGHPATDPGRRDPWIDIHDAQIEFELSAPRAASAKVSQAVTAIGSSNSFANAAAVLKAFDSGPSFTAVSDYPSTAFTLDLLVTTAILRLPFLQPAKLDPSGILVEDKTTKNVEISLPRIRLRLQQGGGTTDPLVASVLSFGANGLDEHADLGLIDLMTMTPPYAFIGTSNIVGFGFRTAVLDTSTGSTPPDVLAQFGFADNWTGIYIPELRIYVAPEGATGLACDASAINLLIGTGQSAGITGDFELEIIDQGSGAISVSARFYDAIGTCYGITGAGVSSATAAFATVTIPDHTRLVVHIDGGLTPYTASAKIGSAATAPGRLFDVDFGTQTSLTIVITAKGSQPGATTNTLTITAALKAPAAPAPSGSQSPSDVPAVTVKTTTIVQGTAPQTAPVLKLVSQTASQAVIALALTDPTLAATTQWTVAGKPAGTGATATVDCLPGATVAVQAVLPAPAVAGGTFSAYYRFDHPNSRDDTNVVAYAGIPGHVKDAPAPDEGLNSPWPASEASSILAGQLQNVPNGTAINIKGYASFEDHDNPSASPPSSDWIRNNSLAQNRAIALQAIVKTIRPAGSFGSVGADMSAWGPAQGGGVGERSQWWKAVASWAPSPAPATTVTGTVTRANANPPVPVPVPNNPTLASPPDPPSWFKKLDLKVRIVRDHLVACEIAGKFDIQTPMETQLAKGGVTGQQVPIWGNVGSQNPADGIIDARMVVQIDDATDIITESMYFGADPADLDGLKYIGTLPGAPPSAQLPSFGQNFFGLAVAFWPLIATTAGAAAGDGAAVDLIVDAIGLGVVAGMAGLGWFSVEHVIWYGAELDIENRPDGVEALMLIDIETGISARIAIGGIQLLTIDRANPLTVRYKAIGFILGNPAGQNKFPFRPYFDSSKGYTVDVSKPGAIQVHDPFDKILKILGARMSRNNPFLVEIDLGFAIDLGVVSIDRARVRLNLSPGGPPELTAFGASVNIPGALQGRGYAEIGPDAHGNSVIKGAMDLTITPVSVRIAATLAIAQISPANGGPATGVQVSLEVDFPVAIPLADSGLGIYGFLGLFAMNFERDESIVPATISAPALAWLKATGGDVTNPKYWTPKINTWAFGVGAILGTEGSDFLLNMKGMVLLELPGPRLLIFMKAKLLAEAAPLGGDAEGLFLAVIDLDFARGTLTIGLSVEFSVDPLIEIKIPVEAFFNFKDTSDWHLYLGTYPDSSGTLPGPVQATVLEVFDASGYLMLSGSGIPAHNGLPQVTGFSIATGLHVSFKWGAGPIYAELAAGFDAVIGFSPFRLAGKFNVRGSLHLVIIDIDAWADLDVDVGDDGHGGHIAQISGDICGEVHFLFFSISGCVHFALNNVTPPAPIAPPLVKALKLVSRSPALAAGTGTDRPIDSVLMNGQEANAAPGGLKTVPIDAVPVLMMAFPPLQQAGLTFSGTKVADPLDTPSGGWVQRGDVAYQYTLTQLELVGPALTAGKTPATWWKSNAGAQALEAQLALLSWVPDATPKALGSSEFLDKTFTEKWGTTCQPVAPPAPVIWSFFFQPLGPSAIGWFPYGLAQPDPPNVVRSAPPDLRLKVTERWRSGDPALDRMRGIVPAQVEGAAVQCPVAPAPASPAPVSPAQTSNVPVATLAGINPIRAIRGGTPQIVDSAERLSVSDVLQRFEAGRPVTTATLAGATVAAATVGAAATSAPPRKCFGWALASPMFDDGELIGFGDQALAPTVKAALAQRGFKSGPLDNAVVLELGAFEYVRLFLWIPRRFLSTDVVVAASSDAHDKLGDQHIVVPNDAVPPVTLPAAWTNPTSPWEPVTFVLEQLASFSEEYVPVFIQIKGGAGFDRVQIGCLPATRRQRQQIPLRPFYVGGIEALKHSEVARQDYDTTQQQAKQGVLNAALGLDSADCAFLQPNATYGVRATWTASIRDAQGHITPVAPPPPQTFWFATDASPPARLDPWILVTLPGAAEQHCFAAEPIKVVFNTNNVGTLYGAYGKKLQARLRAASFVPVPSTPHAPHPFPLSPANLTGVKATILSPWEQAARKLAATTLPCVAGSGETIRHSQVTIPIPLDLFTDYIIDIEMLDAGAADGSPGQSVWRGAFSTGGFATAQDFAVSFQLDAVNHRGVHSEDIGKLQGVGPLFAGRTPQGAEFDAALTAAGVDAMATAKYPGFTVFWDPTTPPQPAAILVDSSEPMARARPLPTLVNDPSPAGAQHWEMLAQPWLDLAPHGGDPIVDAIVLAPGGQRALVTLKPGARGKSIVLALRRIAHSQPYLDGSGAADQFYTILTKTLVQAPWEEVD